MARQWRRGLKSASAQELMEPRAQKESETAKFSRGLVAAKASEMFHR